VSRPLLERGICEKAFLRERGIGSRPMWERGIVSRPMVGEGDSE
jgi:hypothetical protein